VVYRVSSWLRTIVLRHRIRYGVQAALWCAAAMVVLWGLATGSLPGLEAGALLAAAGLVAAASGWLNWRDGSFPVWSTTKIVRRMDDRLALKHRLASTHDVERDQASGSLLAEALASDTQQSISSIRPSTAAPLVNLHTLAALLTTILAVGAVAVWDYRVDLPGEVTAQPARAAEPESNVTVEDVQAAAQQIGFDSSLQDVDALMGAARGLEALLRDAGAGLPQEELNRRFEELMDLARLGYGDTPPSWMTPTGSMEQSLASRIGDYQAARREEMLAASTQTAPAATRPADAEPQASPPRPGALAANPDAQAGEAIPNANTASLPGSAAEAEAPPMLGVPVGASSQSGAGGGDTAGLGSQDLSVSQFAPAEAPRSEMFLPPSETGAGKRIKIDMTLPPAMSGGEGSEGDARGLNQSATRAVSAIRRDLVLAGDAPATARYFTVPEDDEGLQVP
jgi:hypothetical protein